MATERGSEPRAKPHRLFVAVSVPDQVATQVEEALEPWRTALPGVRWTPRSNWHVTLRFLGSTDPRLVTWISDRLSEVASMIAQFEGAARGVGAFPSPRRARVLWAGIDDHDRSFADLARAVTTALDPEFPAEERVFSAHVTVARSDPPVPLPPSFAETPLESDRFVVGSMELMRSRLRRPAPVYEQVAAFPLSGPKGPRPT
ncbi:MAG TPA: RNA 2',3'-cyclic phosphodiesterase [Actinomycetota bacterium]|nr:RNA 2',3'-cyclic phosphodiesterase [Actinomycetota bacterium]